MLSRKMHRVPSQSSLSSILSNITPSSRLPRLSTMQHTSRAFHGLSVNGPRLMDSIHSTCKFGKAHPYGDHPTETGMARLALDDNDKKARHWLADQARAIGCSVTVDQMGNMYVVRAGSKNPSAPPVMMGSHLDTQPTGGRYDGILGIMAGLEVLRTLHENDYQTEGPVGVVNWTNEEGARFPMVTVSSGVWAGSIPLETAWSCKEVTASTVGDDGSTRARTIKEELDRIGFLGAVPASYKAQPMAAHIELHIEQGPILEDERLKIGVVTGAQAYSWYEIEVKGRDSHAGTTPLSARKDALLAAAKMVVASNSIAKEFGGLVTTGILTAKPGSVNTIPDTVRFTLDIRHPSDDKLADLVAACRESFDKIAERESERGVNVSWTTLTENTAVVFHEDCTLAIEQSAHEACAQISGTESSPSRKLWRHMLSGAGHDSCHVNKRSPTAMIFTPTRNGMSHTPDEYCSPDDCILGAQVLLGAVMRFDARRKF